MEAKDDWIPWGCEQECDDQRNFWIRSKYLNGEVELAFHAGDHPRLTVGQHAFDIARDQVFPLAAITQAIIAEMRQLAPGDPLLERRAKLAAGYAYSFLSKDCSPPPEIIEIDQCDELKRGRGRC